MEKRNIQAFSIYGIRKSGVSLRLQDVICGKTEERRSLAEWVQSLDNEAADCATLWNRMLAETVHIAECFQKQEEKRQEHFYDLIAQQLFDNYDLTGNAKEQLEDRLEDLILMRGNIINYAENYALWG